jgi:uncharacterized XkdX family phage protein
VEVCSEKSRSTHITIEKNYKSKGEIKMTHQTENQTQTTTPEENLVPDQTLSQIVVLLEKVLTQVLENTLQLPNQDGNSMVNQMMPLLEKLLNQLSQNPPQNEDNMPGNDNKFMEIDDIVDNLVNAGIIKADSFSVNVELFRGSPITVSITKAGDPSADIKKEINAGESINEDVDAEDIDYFKYVSVLYSSGEYTIEDVANFVEVGKLTPEQYEKITGEKYEESTVEEEQTEEAQ